MTDRKIEEQQLHIPGEGKTEATLGEGKTEATLGETVLLGKLVGKTAKVHQQISYFEM